jgi:AmpE protein
MTFLVVLLAYLLQQKLDLSLSRQVDHWVYLRRHLLAQLSFTESGSLAFLVLGYFLCIVIGFGLFFFIERLFWGVIALPVEVIVLLLCIGQQGYKNALDDYLSFWKKREFEKASICFYSSTREISERKMPPEKLHEAVYHSVLYHHFNRFFLIIFWFVIWGPIGALLVRANDYLCQYSKGVLQDYSRQFQHLLEWLPARFLVLSFAVVGDVNSVMKVFKSRAGKLDLSSREIIVMAASAALKRYSLNPDITTGQPIERLVARGVDTLDAIRDLLSRCMLVWLSVLAFISVVAY